jgi:hypothetical protein
LIGEFDVLATGLFAFREKWDFGFILLLRTVGLVAAVCSV